MTMIMMMVVMVMIFVMGARNMFIPLHNKFPSVNKFSFFIMIMLKIKYVDSMEKFRKLGDT
ncbi:hypothetical protein GS3922_05585 [Geobacillus subterraneus]|uniref:Uncharacterized protein n=1 Tax=Geobacillus subterraneus TaxID=129338 RepID=A0ABN4NJU7_9BACL|nr:hypothetical protein GS3922_05585 [Geobacillus subterraneus]